MFICEFLAIWSTNVRSKMGEVSGWSAWKNIITYGGFDTRVEMKSLREQLDNRPPINDSQAPN